MQIKLDQFCMLAVQVLYSDNAAKEMMLQDTGVCVEAGSGV